MLCYSTSFRSIRIRPSNDDLHYMRELSEDGLPCFWE